MCQYQTLYHDTQAGYIIKCNNCDKIQLAYANMVISFTQEDFIAFKNWMEKMKNNQMEITNPHLRCILIPTPSAGMQMLLSAVELDELLEMLETAEVELQSLALLNLFQS